jgi:predicted transcriptional regulator
MSRTVNEIKDEILDFFRNLKIPAIPGQIIQAQRLNRYLERLNQQEMNNFDKAIQELTAADLIKVTKVTAGWEVQITEKGIEYIER